jgi:hypothetical protein
MGNAGPATKGRVFASFVKSFSPSPDIHIACSVLCDVTAEIAFDDAQGSVDSQTGSARSHQSFVLDEAQTRRSATLGKRAAKQFLRGEYRTARRLGLGHLDIYRPGRFVKPRDLQEVDMVRWSAFFDPDPAPRTAHRRRLQNSYWPFAFEDEPFLATAAPCRSYRPSSRAMCSR